LNRVLFIYLFVCLSIYYSSFILIVLIALRDLSSVSVGCIHQKNTEGIIGTSRINESFHLERFSFPKLSSTPVDMSWNPILDGEILIATQRDIVLGSLVNQR